MPVSQVEAKPALVEKVLRQKLFERTGVASNHELRHTLPLALRPLRARSDEM